MISLETAIRLKDAGLKWEPEEGDFIYYHAYRGEAELGVINDSDMGEHREETLDNIYAGEWIFVSRLDQLLAEIEKRGYRWTLNADLIGEYSFFLTNDDNNNPFELNKADAPDQAAAEALIWIYKQEVQPCEI